jgi:hypothetical protein
MYAFDATNVSKELWDSGQNASRDDYGNFAKFVPPTVANGKVYVATDSHQVCAYGLNPTNPPPTVVQSGYVLYNATTTHLSVTLTKQPETRGNTVVAIVPHGTTSVHDNPGDTFTLTASGSPSDTWTATNIKGTTWTGVNTWCDFPATYRPSMTVTEKTP